MRALYIIKAGTTFPAVKKKYGDFELWTRDSMGTPKDEAVVIDIRNGEPLPALRKCRGVVITGSHAMVTDHLPWSDLILDWIPGIIKEKIPFLGICYGHQLLAEAMGGEVGYHPGGKEIGTVDIRLFPAGGEDPLFKALPGRFPAHVTHSQSVLRQPPGAVPLAFNEFEPCHAFRMGNCAWGVQFHPEYNTDIMKEYILEQADELKTSGRDMDEIMMTVKETPEAEKIMKSFYDFITQQP